MFNFLDYQGVLGGEIKTDCEMELGNGSSFIPGGIEKLVVTNYKYWKMCMEAYLQDQDLWEIVSSVKQEPANIPANVES